MTPRNRFPPRVGEVGRGLGLAQLQGKAISDLSAMMLVRAKDQAETKMNIIELEISRKRNVFKLSQITSFYQELHPGDSPQYILEQSLSSTNYLIIPGIAPWW